MKKKKLTKLFVLATPVTKTWLLFKCFEMIMMRNESVCVRALTAEKYLYIKYKGIRDALY